MLDKNTKIGNGIEVKVFGKKELVNPEYGEVYSVLCGANKHTLACYKAVYVGVKRNKNIFIAEVDSDIFVFSSRPGKCYGVWFNENVPTIPMIGLVSNYLGRIIGREREFASSLIKKHLESCLNYG